MEPEMSDGQQMRQAYAALVAQCPPYLSEGPWKGFSDRRAVRGPADPIAAFATLRSQFPDDVLQEAGIAVLDATGHPVLNPVLSGPQSCFIPLQAKGEALPFDVLTSSGCLTGRTIPAVAVLHDRPLEATFEDFDHLVCVCFNMADVAVLRGIGLRATMAKHLENVGGESLQELRSRFGWISTGVPTTASASPATVPMEDASSCSGERDTHPEHGVGIGPAESSSSRPEMIFVGWSPATMSIEAPAGLRIVREHFTKIESCLRVMLDEVSVWAPSDMERMRFTLEFGRMEDVQAAVCASLDESTKVFTVSERVLPPDLRTCRSRLETQVYSDGQESEQDLWQALEDGIERELIDPVMDAARGTQDPLKRNQIIGAAEVYRLLHRDVLLKTVQHSRSVRESGVRRTEGMSTAELQKLTVLLSRVADLVRDKPGTSSRQRRS